MFSTRFNKVYCMNDEDYLCEKYPSKWLCPPMNDNLPCKDCLYSILKYN